MEDRVRCELVKLHTVNEKKPTKKLVGRKRQSTKEEGKEHHPITARGLRNPLGAWELDGVVARDEAVRPGLLHLLLHDGRGTQLVAEFVVFPLAMVFLTPRCFTRIYKSARRRRRERAGKQYKTPLSLYIPSR
jgi:hypothetical protein